MQNFPTVGIIDGQFRQNLEETGMGFSHEVDMIRAAHEHDLLTTPYVFNEREAIAMAEAGADIIVCHMGLTTGGSIGAATGVKLADCPPLINAWSAAARQVDQTSSCCATAGRSPRRRMRSSSWPSAPNAMASTEPRAWSACRPSRRSSKPHVNSEDSEIGGRTP